MVIYLPALQHQQPSDKTEVILMNRIYEDPSDGQGVIEFIWHANQDIIAGYPYLIRPSQAVSAVTTNSAFTTTNPLFSVTQNNQTIDYDVMGTGQGYVFRGNFSEVDIPLNSYVLNTSGQLAQVTKSGLKLKPFRAYLDNTSGAHAKKLKSMSVSKWDDLDDESGTTTSIDVILEENGIFTKTADVYDLNGVLVRKNAHTIQGLPKGIYIVNGKKHVVK